MPQTVPVPPLPAPATSALPNASTTWRPRLPVDVLRTLSPLSRGRGDPTHRVEADGALWRTTSAGGGATYRLVARGLHEVRCEAWGPGAERVVAGPGIVAIYETLAEMEGRSVPSRDDRTIWTEAIDGTDSIALAALDRFCLALGAVAGDLALAQGAKAVVIAGGLGFRIKDRLVRSGFDQRFVAKGRFQTMMAAMPVKLITHPQPGLFGAAAAFAQEHTQ